MTPGVLRRQFPALQHVRQKLIPGNRGLPRRVRGQRLRIINWTEKLMQRPANQMDGLSLHYYTVPTGDW